MNFVSLIKKERLYKISPSKVAKFIKNYRNYRSFDMEPIIIGGAPRSGTTLLLAILGAHSAIHSVKTETMAFSLIRPDKRARKNHRHNMRKFLSYLLLENIEPAARRWCEKTPNNIHHIQTINEEFRGKVKFIHIIRDGRDVVTSKHPTRPGEYYVEPETWIDNVTWGLKVQDLPNMHTIKYEDILNNFHASISALLKHLDLDWEESLKNFHASTTVSSNVAFEKGKVRALHKESAKKWMRPEHRERLEEFYKNKEAVALLEQLGYDTYR